MRKKIFLIKAAFCFGICFVLTIPQIVSAQKMAQSISGTVTDESGNPIRGVTIIVEGTKIGTLSDSTGKFILKRVPEKGVISFSMIGYVAQRRMITPQIRVYNISLVSSSSNLNDVVIIGYGSVKKKDMTGAVGSVDVADLQKAPVRSFDEALAGRVAGVQVSSEDGQPGSPINIIVRGASSITQETAPLYVIDGFPMAGSDFNANQLDPNEIESIDVLKDAAATAIYGARGSNGVIVITTKRGMMGAPVISFNLWHGIQHNIKKMNMLNTEQWAQLQADNQVANPPNVPYDSVSDIYNYDYDYYIDSTRPVDWQNLLFRTAMTDNYSLNIRGGNSQTKYSVSGNYLNQNGTIINSGYKRYQGRITLDQQVSKKLKVGADVTYTNTLQSGISPSAVASSSASGSLMYNILGYRPFSGLSDSAYDAVLSDPIDDDITSSNNYTFNPYINQKHLVRTTEHNILNANGYAEYAITPKLKFRSTIAINRNATQSIAFNDTLTQLGSQLTPVGSAGANGSVGNEVATVWSNENYLTYDNRFGKHSLNVVAGVSEQKYKMSSYTMSNKALSNPGLGIAGIAQSDSSDLATISESSDNWSTSSFYGRASYDYASKYYFSASVRADGSSKFTADNRWAWFPAFSAKWRISQEPFWKKITAIVPEAALRLSYGTAGNNRITSFLTATSIKTAIGTQGYTFLVGDGSENTQATGAYVSVLGNPDLKWETSKTLNLGLDMSFLNDLINLTVDAYRKKTYNLLYNAPIPTSTGYSTMMQNIGSIQNQGLEITLNTTNVQTKTFTWRSSFNISFNNNKVLSLVDGMNEVGAAVNWSSTISSVPAYILKVGQPLGTLYGLKWVGNYQYSDFTKNAAGQYMLKDNVPSNQTSRNTSAAAAPQPGDIKFADINGDGVITSDDYVPIGRGFPIHTGGFGNDFSYKNFDLNIFFQWSYGNQIQNANRMIFEANTSGNNQFASVLNRWTPQNQNNIMFRAGTGSPGGGTYYSSRTVEDGSYLRLKTVQLGYNLPNALMKKWKIKQIRLYISGQNLITWTKYTGFDPEVGTFYSTITPGFDWGAYPRARTVTIGANLSF